MSNDLWGEELAGSTGRQRVLALRGGTSTPTVAK
jgi:hypothetical protein